MKLKDTKVNQGGLMRCCLASLAIFVSEEEPDREAEDGTMHRCRYEAGDGNPMILENGTWRWNREEVFAGMQ